jgi:hypothetical protein
MQGLDISAMLRLREKSSGKTKKAFDFSKA